MQISIDNLLSFPDTIASLMKETMFIQSVLKATKGKFFTVVFIKKDGTTRVMNCRLGVTKHLKGGMSTLNPSEFLTVYDMQAEGYRAINLSTIVSVTCGGITLTNGK